MSAPVWEGIAAQLTLLDQPLMAAFILILLVTFTRPPQTSGIEKEGCVPQLLPLLPCWSVVIAASETGGRTRTEVRDGLQWVNKLGSKLVSITLQWQRCSTQQPFPWERHGVLLVSQWSQHRSGARVQKFARSSKTR